MRQGLDDNIYRTTDLALAASLLSLHCPLSEISRSPENRRATFVFTLNEAEQGYVAAFWNDSLKLNPRTYFDNVKQLKNRLYAD